MSLLDTAPQAQAPAAIEPPRRTIAVTATEGPDWSWSFAPAVPDAVAGRLAALAAEMADAAGLLDELYGLPVWAMDLETDLAARRQEELRALAFDESLRLGYPLRQVIPAVGRPRERGGEA